MNNILKTSLFLLLLFLINIVQAETEANSGQTVEPAGKNKQSQPEQKQYYIIEVVLFKHLNEQGKNNEYWSRPDIIHGEAFTGSYEQTMPQSQAQNLTDDIPALARYDLQSKYFSPLRNGIAALSPENYKLTDSANHIKYSQDYRLLAHFGWTQRSLSKKRALPVLLTSNQFSNSLIPSGELKLYVSRYLHMQIDLSASECVYQASTAVKQTTDIEGNQVANSQSDSNQCVNNRYLFKQKRKMRSKELHYLDNPIYSMLVYVTPFTI